MNKTVVVGMSGGVDSSVAAFLLKEKGYNVIGVTMQIWQDEVREQTECKGGCCGLSAVDDARRVAAMLDIPYYVMNFKQEFQKNVIDYFVNAYQEALTPNPCIACNRYVKWESLLNKSLAIGADYIATGHYARIEQLSNGRYSIRNSVTQDKDQTYSLYNLTQHQLEHTLMPVGEYTKPEIRQIALEAGLPVANKPDSQEICFVEDNNYAGFVEKECGHSFPKGNFVDKNGKVLGQHNGIIHYTVGQRKGLNLALGRPVFVTGINKVTNEVIIGEADDVFGITVKADKLNLMAVEDFEGTLRLKGKIRYSHNGAMCSVTRTGPDSICCIFDEPVRAITPGQALVLYDGDHVFGGSTIICI